MRRPVLVIHILLGLLLSARPADAQAFWDLPMNPDATTGYVYTGNVTWVQGSEVRTDSIVWTMRILDAVQRRNLRAWKITGHPMDLAWYKPGMKPIPRTVVEVAGKSYYVSTANVFDRIRDKSDSLRDLVWESELVLDLPLSKGRAFGETQSLRREDGMYVWRVEDISAEAGKNGAATANDFVYTVVYRAKNSVILTEWRKGTGLVRYRYRHLGAATDCDVRFERKY